MPTRKIKDLKRFNPCMHPEHDPPSMMVFEPGVYEHECPACHRVITFTVHGTYCMSDRPVDDGTNPMHAFGHGRGD